MKHLAAVWKPAWYALDQPLTVGETATFSFLALEVPLRFATDILDANKPQVKLRAQVVSIYNKQLGNLRKIDTRGLSYKFYVASEAYVQIDAEETPGWLEHSGSATEFLLELEF